MSSKYICLIAVLFGSGATAGTTQTDLLSGLPLRFEETSRDHFTAKMPGMHLDIGARTNVLTWTDLRNTPISIRTRFVGARRQARVLPLDLADSTANYFLGPSVAWRRNVRQYRKISVEGLYPGIDLVFYGNEGALEYDFIVRPHADPGAIQFELSGADAVNIDAAGDLTLLAGGRQVHLKAPRLYQPGNSHVEGRFEVQEQRVRFRIGPYDHARRLVIDPVLSYASYVGGQLDDSARAIATDQLGNVYIAGITASTNLAVTAKAYQTSFAGQTYSDFSGDAFVAKFNASGGLVYMTFLGGTGDDLASAIAVDSTGVYVTGVTTSTDFPVTMGALQQRFGGFGGNECVRGGDAFVAKLSPDGSKLVYSTYLGGKNDDGATGIAIDSSGNAYITGATLSIDFPVTSGVVQSSYKGTGGQLGEPSCGGVAWISTGDGFISKLNASGSQLLFSTYLGGSLDDFPSAIALDSSRNIYVAGYTLSQDFPVTQGALQTVFGGSEVQNPYFITGDGFIVKLDSNASTFIYSTYLGGSGDEAIMSLAVLKDGSVWLTGATTSLNFPVTSNAFQKVYAGYITLPFNLTRLYGDAFVAHLNGAGTTLLYSTYLGGSQNDFGQSIAVDSSGLVYVIGSSDSYNLPVTSNALQNKMAGDGGQGPYDPIGDGFVAVIDPVASRLVYCSYFGASLNDQLWGLVPDGAGGLWVTGNTVSPDLPVTSNAFQKVYGGLSNRGQLGGWTGDALLVHFSNLASPQGPSILTDGSGVINGGSYQSGNIVSGSWASIKGTGFTDKTADWSSFDFSKGVLPTSLNGVQVLFNGQPGAIWYLIAGSPQQINVQAPANLNGTVAVQVTVNGVTSNTVNTTAVQVAPAIFPYSLDNGKTFYASAVFPDGVILGDPALAAGLRKAHAGDKLSLFANSLAPSPAGVVTVSASTDPITVTIGAVTVEADFSGLVAPGEFQINFTVPNLGNAGNYPITIQIDSKASQPGVLLPYSN